MSTNGYSGLCSTCVGRSTCTFPHYEDRPRIFCEEHDWTWQRQMALTAAATVTDREPVSRLAAAPPKVSRYKGLCATCDKQDECMHPKPGGGVWHCEEFE